MWQQCVGVCGVLQPPKWRENYKRPSNVLVIHRRSCSNYKISAGAGRLETDDGSGSSSSRLPSLPYSVRLRLAAFAAAQRSDGSLRYQLLSIGDLKASASHVPDAMGVRSADITMDASIGLWARVFSPSVTADEAPLPVVVYFHGGGFLLFSAASGMYDGLCRRLCRELRAVIVSVNYRLARVREHRFPAAYNDGVTALRYLDANALPSNIAAVPIDLSSCFIAGDSAGGNIAHHVAQRWASLNSISPPANLRVAGAILIQPLFGGEERTRSELQFANVCPTLTLATADFCWKEFLPEGANRDHAAAGFVDEVDYCFLPATMVVTGGFDILKDRHAKYVEEKKGNLAVRLVEYPDAIHGFYLFPEIVDAGKLMADIKLFVQQHMPNKFN